MRHNPPTPAKISNPRPSPCKMLLRARPSGRSTPKTSNVSIRPAPRITPAAKPPPGEYCPKNTIYTEYTWTIGISCRLTVWTMTLSWGLITDSAFPEHRRAGDAGGEDDAGFDQRVEAAVVHDDRRDDVRRSRVRQRVLDVERGDMQAGGRSLRAEGGQVGGGVQQQQPDRGQGHERDQRRRRVLDGDVLVPHLGQGQQKKDRAEARPHHRLHERQIDRAQPGPDQRQEETVRPQDEDRADQVLDDNGPRRRDQDRKSVV